MAEKVVGQGTFGIVFKANVEETGEVVAIKKVYQDKRYKNRELQILRELDHPNIIYLKHAFYTKGEKQDELYLNAVTEYIPDTVSRVTRTYAKNKQHLPLQLVKLYAWQMFRAMAYIHSKQICHRDIKPQNLLIDPASHVLKVCDFGSAKKLVVGEPNVSYICSRYYRAPELIFGATHYTVAIDMWSVGTVIGEMLLGHPLFPGESAVDQLVEIIKVLGTPTKEQICTMNENYNEYKFPQIRAASWQQVFKRDLTPETYDFMSKILLYEPHLRLKPLQSLLHPFFDELYDPQTRTPENKPLPELFNFTKEEFDYEKDSIAKILEKRQSFQGV